MTKWNTVTDNRLDEQTTMKDFQRQYSRLEKLMCIFHFVYFMKVSTYISNMHHF